MKMRSPASSELPHADIAAKIDYRDLWEDRIHDVLHGYVDVPTHPEPIRLRLTKFEIAHRWHMIACEALNAIKDGGDVAAIAQATKAVDWTGAVSCFESTKEAIGDLHDGRFLTYRDHEIRHGIYRLIDGDGHVIAGVQAGDGSEIVGRLLAAYEAGAARGRKDAQATLRSALGIL